MMLPKACFVVSGCGFTLASFTLRSEFGGFPTSCCLRFSELSSREFSQMVELRFLPRSFRSRVSVLQTCILGGLVYSKAVMADEKQNQAVVSLFYLLLLLCAANLSQLVTKGNITNSFNMDSRF